MYQFIVHNTKTGMPFTIQLHLFYISGIRNRTNSANNQLFFFIIARIELNGYFIECRNSKSILGYTGTNGIKSHNTEKSTGRQRNDYIISRNAIRPRSKVACQ